MDSGRVMHASRDRVHVLRFIGDIRYTLSPSIDRFVQEIFAASSPAGFVIDLTSTDSIDSTNLGLLAGIAKRMAQAGGPRVRIVSDRGEINAILSSMALDEVFDIVKDGRERAGEEREIPQEEADRDTMARTLVETHRALMELSKHNEEMFRDVVSSLERNVHKS
jgi:anti-anti-sigma factor